MKSKIRWIYVILGIIIMMCLGTVYSWSIFRLPIEELFDIGTTQSGLPYMISLAFYAIFMGLTGRFIDKYSPKLIISLGGLLVAIGWILSAFATNIYILTITYGVIIGAGVGIAYGAPMTVVTRWFPKKKGLVVGLVLGGFGLSPLVTAPLARDLIEQFGITNTFKILGIAFGIIIPLIALPFKYPEVSLNKTSDSNSTNSKDINTNEMLKSSSFKGLYCNFIIGTMIGLTIIGMTTNVGVELIKLSPSKVALLMSLFAIFNGLGRPTFGWLTDKLSSKKSMMISYGLIMTAAILMVLAKEGNIILYSIAFCVFWFNLGGWLAIAPTSTIALYGTKYYSQNYGIVFTAYGIGAIVGVLGSGLLLDILNNYYAVFYLVIGVCITGLILTQKTVK